MFFSDCLWRLRRQWWTGGKSDGGGGRKGTKVTKVNLLDLYLLKCNFRLLVAVKEAVVAQMAEEGEERDKW